MMYINVDAAGCPNTCRHCAAGGHAPWDAYYSLEELRSLRAEWVPLTIYFEPTAHPDFPRVYEPDVATDYGGTLVSNGFGLARREDYRQVLEGMHALRIQEVCFRLDRALDDPAKNRLCDPEGLTAAAWLERWEQASDAGDYMHIFEPRSWPPDVTYEHLCLILRRDRQVYLDPVCSSPIHLGQLSDGKEAILERLGSLPPPPCWDIGPGDVEFSPEELDRLHSCTFSVRYVAISKARRQHA